MISHPRAFYRRTNSLTISLKGAAAQPARYHAAPGHSIQAHPCLLATAENVISEENLASWPCSRLNQNKKWDRQSSRQGVAGRNDSVHKQEMSTSFQCINIHLGRMTGVDACLELLEIRVHQTRVESSMWLQEPLPLCSQIKLLGVVGLKGCGISTWHLFLHMHYCVKC